MISVTPRLIDQPDAAGERSKTILGEEREVETQSWYGSIGLTPPLVTMWRSAQGWPEADPSYHLGLQII